MKERLRVLHIMSGFGGGISSFIRNKAEYMVNENIQFDVVTYDECPKEFKEVIYQTGGEVYNLINPKINGWQAFKDSFTSVLKENNYDIIYSHINGYRILPYYYYVRKYSKAPFYVHSHSSHYPKFMQSKQKQLNIRMDQLINQKVTDKIVGCGSLSIKHIFGENVQEEEMVVIPNSVDVERFIKNPEHIEKLRQIHRATFQLTENDLVIGHIGRLETVKNHELTIQMAEKIKRQQLEMKILIIGEGNRETELKTIVSEKQLTDVIFFTGRISPIEDFYPALDVVLLPSFSEGLPTVVVEAQASGVPVVMSNTITEEVDLGFDMLKTVSLKADPSEWIKAVEKTKQVRVPKAAIREKAIIEKKFSNETSAQLYTAFLRGKISQYTIL